MLGPPCPHHRPTAPLLCPCPRGEAVVVVSLDGLDPGLATDAAFVVEALEAEAGGLYCL